MRPLTPAFTRFFRGLARHNRRGWYHAHKAEYEELVRRPFEELVEEMIHRIGAVDASVRGLTAREATFRLARDVRFTKDKTPYKLAASAVIAPGGRKQSRAPGFYFEIGADRIGIAGGIYQPDKETLLRIRRAIAERGGELEQLLAGRTFRRLLHELQGERNVRLPPEFAPVMARHPLVAQRQFYYWVEYARDVGSGQGSLSELLMRHYRAGRPACEWLARAAGSPAPYATDNDTG
jgi:uncharacterized protein (TIGR02453 family)